jgi:FtsP/CotA-like multicopper oxidase with cupredoxin domain
VDRQLMRNITIQTWDGRAGGLTFFVFTEQGNAAAAGGTYPAGTIRVPRGAIYHASTVGSSPAPHTIHWHGIEPTPLNDGVGHCSMEIGVYTYQWQPNFSGTTYLSP